MFERFGQLLRTLVSRVMAADSLTQRDKPDEVFALGAASLRKRFLGCHDGETTRRRRSLLIAAHDSSHTSTINHSSDLQLLRTAASIVVRPAHLSVMMSPAPEFQGLFA